MDSISIEQYTARKIERNISVSTLRQMLAHVREKPCVIVGFNDYAKHIINVASENVVAVVDIDKEFIGISFREHTVQAATKELLEGQTVLYTEADLISDFQRATADIFGEKPIHQILVKDFHKLDVYRDQQTRDPQLRIGEPISMMPEDTLTFLIELLSHAMRNGGDVVEIGVWQGGASWNMLNTMAKRGDIRQLHCFDAFDDWPRNNPEAIMCADEISRRLSRISNQFRLYRGLVEHTHKTSAISKICFAHIDMGYRTPILEWLMERMDTGSVILMDNYQHMHAFPHKFDAFFARRGYHVIRVPFSYQALVVL